MQLCLALPFAPKWATVIANTSSDLELHIFIPLGSVSHDLVSLFETERLMRGRQKMSPANDRDGVTVLKDELVPYLCYLGTKYTCCDVPRVKETAPYTVTKEF